MGYIEIPKTRPMSDIERFIVGLRQLAIECNVTGISGLEVYFGDGTFVGIAKEIRKYCPDRELNIFVTHMVNHRGNRKSF